MGRAGRTPLTEAECKRRGFDAKAKERSGGPSPEAKCPDPPAWISEAARGEWDAIVPMIDAMGCVGDVDQIALATGCQAIVDYIEACELLAKEGLYCTSDKGSVTKHPAATIRNETWAQVNKFCREFGMTPAARAGMGIAMHRAKTEKDARERFTIHIDSEKQA